MNANAAPRYGRIPDAEARYAASRSGLYRLAAEHPGLLVKMGGATLVNYAVLDDIYRNLPPAQIKPPQQAA